MTSDAVAVTTDLPDDQQEALAALAAQGAQSELSFAELVKGTAVVQGRLLCDKAELVGVPHIITGVSFRPMGSEKHARDFVSVEATDAANRAIVYNDGSTGVRRQVCEYLMAHKVIPQGDPDTIVADVADQSVTFDFVNDGKQTPTLASPRGLRFSDYTNEFGDARTYYIS